jgi:hypothetical protein
MASLTDDETAEVLEQCVAFWGDVYVRAAYALGVTQHVADDLRVRRVRRTRSFGGKRLRRPLARLSACRSLSPADRRRNAFWRAGRSCSALPLRAQRAQLRRRCLLLQRPPRSSRRWRDHAPSRRRRRPRPASCPLTASWRRRGCCARSWRGGAATRRRAARQRRRRRLHKRPLPRVLQRLRRPGQAQAAVAAHPQAAAAAAAVAEPQLQWSALSLRLRLLPCLRRPQQTPCRRRRRPCGR